MASPACHKPPALPRLAQRPHHYSPVFPIAPPPAQPDPLTCSSFSCSFAISASGPVFRNVLDACPPSIAPSSPLPPAAQGYGSTEISGDSLSSAFDDFSSSSDSDNEGDDFCSGSASLQLAFDVRPAQEGPLDSFSSMCAALPIKRGLSRHFSGKSQSFSSLASVSSVSQLAKPENRYAKRRRTAFPSSGSMLNCHSYPPRCPPAANGMSEKLATHDKFESLKSNPSPNEGASAEGLAKCFSVPDF